MLKPQNGQSITNEDYQEVYKKGFKRGSQRGIKKLEIIKEIPKGIQKLEITKGIQSSIQREMLNPNLEGLYISSNILIYVQIP